MANRQERSEAQVIADEERMQAAMARAYARAEREGVVGEPMVTASGAIIVMYPFIAVTEEDL